MDDPPKSMVRIKDRGAGGNIPCGGDPSKGNRENNRGSWRIRSSVLFLLSIFLSCLLGTDCHNDSYFSHSNFNISVKSDVNVHVDNGTFNVFNLAMPGDNDIGDMIKSKMESLFSKVSTDVRTSMIDGEGSIMARLNLTMKDSSKDEKSRPSPLRMSKGPSELTTTKPAPTEKVVKDEKKPITTVKPILTTKSTLSKKLNESIKSTTSKPQLAGGYQGDSSGVDRVSTTMIDCGVFPQELLRANFVEDREALFKLLTPKDNGSNSSALYSEHWDMAEMTLIEECMTNPGSMHLYINKITSTAAVGISGFYTNQYDASANDVIEAIATISSEYLANIPSYIVKSVVKSAKSVMKKRSRVSEEMENVSSPKTRRKRGASEDADAFSDIDGIVSSVVSKKMKEYNMKARRSKVPMDRVLVSDSLNAKVAKIPNRKDHTDRVENIFATESRIEFRYFLLSRTAAIVGAMTFRRNDDEMDHMVHRKMEGIKRTLNLPKCENADPMFRKMIAPCSVAILGMLMKGDQLCLNVNTCPAESIFSKDGTSCIPKGDCVFYGVSLNYESMSMTPGVYLSKPWENALPTHGIAQSEKRVICEINKVPISSTIDKCKRTGQFRRETLFKKIHLITFKNGSRQIGLGDNVLVPKLYLDDIDSYSCNPSDSCSGCSKGEMECIGDINFCSRKGVKCVLDSECSCAISKNASTMALCPLVDTDDGIEVIKDLSMDCSQINHVIEVWASIDTMEERLEQIEGKDHSCTLDTVCNLGTIHVESNCNMRAIKVTMSNRAIWMENGKVIKGESEYDPSSNGVKEFKMAIPWDIVLEVNPYTKKFLHVF